MEINDILSRVQGFLWEFGPKVLISLLIYIIGSFIIKKASFLFKEILKANKIDESLGKFFTSVVDMGLKVILLLIVAGRLGFETTSFIAIFSALTLAIGFALQGSLGNFASGVLILLFKPYKIGDLITVNERTGTVEEIQIFSTLLSTPQGKKIIIPNGKVTEGPIENISCTEDIRVDIVVDVMDNTSFNVLKAILNQIIESYPHRIINKESHIKVIGFPSDAMSIEIGCWTCGVHYWDAYYYLFESVKKSFDEHGIQLAKEDAMEND